jgi:UDP-N-acetylmuramate dehydrogenase
VGSLRETIPKIKTRLPVLVDEPMSEHTTLAIGGPADFLARPSSRDEAIELCRLCRNEGRPFFVLGAGANILVSDRGIRGVVIDTSAMAGIERAGDAVSAGSGAPVSGLSAFAASSSLAGLEFVYSMPGSVGGSVWMNARCYGASISDSLCRVEYVDAAGEPEHRDLEPQDGDFSYKRSPFQSMTCIITRATFRLRPGDRTASLRAMDEHRADRERKGHFLFPSAGSAFKNDPAFGAPTGKIVDELGLRGFRVGGAAVAEYHGNIVINSGGATAADVLAVLRHVERVARDERGLHLEREVLLVGDWEPSDINGQEA